MKMDHFKIVLKEVCENMASSYGSIDFVKTEGVSVLGKESEYWVEFGASNLYEICMRADDIQSMLANYDGYDDVKEQFMPDLLAVLDDLVYHASIFNIYYNSAINHFLIDSGNQQYIDGEKLSNYMERVAMDNIAGDWEINLSTAQKKDIILQLSELMFSICALCKRIEDYPLSAFELFDQLHYVTLQTILLPKQLRFSK